MTDSLETCKLALDKGLITADDFNAVKESFLKAQQIKAGVDAGLIEASEYERLRDAYIANVLSTLTSQVSIGNGTHSVVSSAPPSAPNSARVAPPVAAPPAVSPPAAAPLAAPVSPAAAAPSPTPASGVLPIPTNIPDFGGKKNNPQGTSISGIDVSKDAVNLYYLIKAKAQYRWAMWKVDGSGKQVVIAAVGAKTSSFQEFLSQLPPSDCRYAVFDYQYINSEGIAYSKIVFLNWAPDNANIRSKMMYASTKDFFRGYLDGVSVEFQASELDEVQEGEVHEAVKALVVRK